MSKTSVYFAAQLFALAGLAACAAPSLVRQYPVNSHIRIPTSPPPSSAALSPKVAMEVTRDCMSEMSCRRWLHERAAAGDPLFQLALGQAYHMGWGITKDDVGAAHWWDEAANRGQPEAQYALGMAYIWGYGVPVDLRTAHFWLNRAVAKLDPGGVRNMAIDARDVITPALDMPTDQLAAVERRFRGHAAAPQ
jgi:TPR repeat protein